MEVKTDGVWSTQDVVDNASSWTLAGDAALLKHLESFSENLFAKATETNDKLNGLLHNLNAASIKLDLVKNEFLSLQNTQFIESRVYEDDETVESVQETVEVKKSDEETRKLALKNAVLAGLEIMHKSYDKVRMPASDSEDEEGDGGSFVLSMKDPYMSRPLPYVIGTEDWYKDTHVGLEESESDSEPECEKQEIYSDSDSESNLPVTDRRGVSTSDSGTDISNRIERPVANSTFNDTMASTDSEEYNNSVPAKAPISNVSFAEQLAARLGNVAVQSKEEELEPEPEINRRPLQKAPPMPARVLADLDEPPPLDDFDDALFTDKGKQGMFSGGDGLFDESGDENNTFWGTKRVEDKRDSLTSKSVEQSQKEEDSKITRGLFDDEESDEDIFATAVAAQPPQKSILKPFSNTISFVDDEPPEIPDKSKDKISFNPDDKLLINAEHRPPKKLSLFDDADFKNDPFSEGGLFGSGNGLFAGIGKKDSAGGLFDDEDNLFASVRKTEKKEDSRKSSFLDEKNEAVSTKKSSILKKSSFLHENEESEDVVRFPKKPVITKEYDEEEKPSAKKLFDDEDDAIGIHEDEEVAKQPLFAEDVKKSTRKQIEEEFRKDEGKDVVDKNPKTKEERRLFSEDEDLFSSFGNRNEVKKPTGLFEDIEDIFTDNSNQHFESTRDFTKTSEETKSTFSEQTNTSLFDDDGLDEKPQDPLKSVIHFVDSTPPPDDDWETKSDNLFDDGEDFFEEVPVFSTQTSNPFDEEPPILEPELKKPDLKSEVKAVKKSFPNDSHGESEVKEVKRLFEDDSAVKKPFKDGSNEESEVKEVKRLFEDDSAVKKPFEDGSNEESEVKEVKRLFEDDSNIKEVKKPEIKVKPSLKAKDEVKLKDDGDNKHNLKEESPKKAPPGKLKHNLNINVSALMPGAALPRKKELTSSLNKSHSLEEAGSKSNDVEGALKVAHTQSYRDVRASDEEQGIHDDDDGHIKPLHSYTKNRARVPMKRKPSTRRGRQESMRKHVVESSDELKAEDVTDNNYLQSDGGEREQLNNNLIVSTSGSDDVCNLEFAKSSAASRGDTFVTSKSKSDSSNCSKGASEDEFVDDSSGSDIFTSATSKSNYAAAKSDNLLESDFITSKRDSLIDARITSNVKSDSSLVTNVTSKVDALASDTISNVSSVKDGDGYLKSITSKVARDNNSNVTPANTLIITSKLEGVTSKVDTRKKQTQQGAINSTSGLFEDDGLFAKDAVSKDSTQLFDDDVLFNSEGKLSDTSRDLFGDTEDVLFNNESLNRRKPQVSSSKAGKKNEKSGNVALNKGKQSRSSSLFDDDDDSFDIFAKRPSSAKVATTKKDVVLFEDNDEDLFTAKPSESKPKKSLFAEEKPQFKPARKKGSLFDDVSEDDDIFGSGTRTVTKVSVQDKKLKAKSLVRKAEEREVTYDPLDALSGNPNLT